MFNLASKLVEEYPFIREGIDELIVMEMIKQTESGYEITADLKNGNLAFEKWTRNSINCTTWRRLLFNKKESGLILIGRSNGLI